MSKINLQIEKVYSGAEMLPLERMKLYTWTSKLIKPKNILDITRRNLRVPNSYA